MTGYSEATIWLFVDNYVLCLAEISCIALSIKSTDNESPAHAAGIFPRNQDEWSAWIQRLNWYESINDRNSERWVLEINKLLKHLVIKGKLVNIIDAIRVNSKQIFLSKLSALITNQLLYWILDALSQINRVAEVEAFIFLECFNHIDKFLILLFSTT